MLISNSFEMKNILYKQNNILTLFLFFILLIFSTSCELDEEPIFLDDSIYDSVTTAESARDGIYEGLTNYDAQERRYFIVNGFSGTFGTGRGGNNVNNLFNRTLMSLKPTADTDNDKLWERLYRTISRCNAAINNVTTGSRNELNDVAGHGYFMRAWTYYYLVRLYGDVPLWTELPSSTNFSLPLTSEREVYTQIISDAKMAQNLMNGSAGTGYPTRTAADMLLAKVYMTLATSSTLKEDGISESDYWQMAYDEAIKVYGKHSLIPSFGDLFDSRKPENTSESIFELQISEAANNSQMGRNYTPFKFKTGMHFGWFSVMASVYDYHVATYPNDTRIDGTYLTTWNRADNGNVVNVYPNRSRNNFRNAHPYFKKFAEKEPSHANQFNDQNIIIYRYAELLLMLAEISNELGLDTEKMTYLNEVLDRAGVLARPEYSQGKEAFRDAIMDEYKFEVLGEGEDFHHNRRRGFNYFLTHTIKRHNDLIGTEHYVSNRDITLSEDESQVMKIPLSKLEIDTNEYID